MQLRGHLQLRSFAQQRQIQHLRFGPVASLPNAAIGPGQAPPMTQSQRVVDDADKQFQQFATECEGDGEVEKASAFFHRAVERAKEECLLELAAAGDKAECRSLHQLEELALSHMAEAGEVDYDLQFEGLIGACRTLDTLEARHSVTTNAPSVSTPAPSYNDYGCDVHWPAGPDATQACLQSVFQDLDADNDGRIDRGELQLGLESLLGTKLTDQDMLAVSAGLEEFSMTVGYDDFTSVARDIIPSLRSGSVATASASGSALAGDVGVAFLRHAARGHEGAPSQLTN